MTTLTEETRPSQPRAGQPGERLDRLVTVVLLVFYAALAIYYVFIDYSFAISLHPWFGLVYAALGALPGLLIVVRRRPRAPIVALALFVALILAMPWLDIGERKTFLRAAYEIRPGMTLAEVDQRLARYERFPSTPGSLDDDIMAVYSHKTDAGDSDAVVVMFVEGQVVDTDVLVD
ncbi:MAG: hypothetical protein DIU80_011070 [Chloroflexota bacterium]|nr:MAG: hypothetical protein DIU80_15565 [Chloroflexota bacterium]